jgi:hypothetical protein
MAGDVLVRTLAAIEAALPSFYLGAVALSRARGLKLSFRVACARSEKSRSHERVD